jgi:hypothetical protein
MKLSKNELFKECQEKGIKNYKSKNKKDLINLLEIFKNKCEVRLTKKKNDKKCSYYIFYFWLDNFIKKYYYNICIIYKSLRH